MPTTVPCAKCGRPVSDQAKRCLYCGTYRITAQPGTPEYEAEKKAADEDAKRVERQKVIYAHGMGLGKSAAKPTLVERLSHESLPVRLAASLIALPLLAIWPPLGIKWVKGLFLT
ncbi:MAG TPA: zinc ribbon domain-containing protein [Gemmatimonadales bacterium]|nr:zinc ribbon domain-containing protein [Gemmatimonadales bacterium]